MLRDFGGDFAKFKQGERVKVTACQSYILKGFTIERVRWKGTLVPLANILVGVPRSAFKYEKAAKTAVQKGAL